MRKQQGGFAFVIIMLMDLEPNTENVVYIDEYPELEERLRLRRMAQGRRLGSEAVYCSVFVLPRRTEPETT